MKDLAGALPGGPVDVMVPTSETAGNRIHDNSRAMTAPGGKPANFPDRIGGDRLEFTVPDVDVTEYDPKGRVHVVNDAGGKQIPDSNTVRPTLFTSGDGHGWNSAKNNPR